MSDSSREAFEQYKLSYKYSYLFIKSKTEETLSEILYKAGWKAAKQDSAKTIAELQAENDALRKDAERYRWSLASKQMKEYGVWHPEDGLLFTSISRELCNSHINDALMDVPVDEYAKALRIVEVTYFHPTKMHGEE